MVFRLIWHAKNGRKVGSEGQSLVFAQGSSERSFFLSFGLFLLTQNTFVPCVWVHLATPPLAAGSSSAPSSRVPSSNLSKLPPPPRHLSRNPSISPHAIPSSHDRSATSPPPSPLVYARPNPYRSSALFASEGKQDWDRINPSSLPNSDSITPTSAPPPPPPLPPVFRVASRSSDSETHIHKVTERASSSSSSSDEHPESDVDLSCYQTPISDSEFPFKAVGSADPVEVLSNPTVPSPRPSPIRSQSTKTAISEISPSNPFRSRLRSASVPRLDGLSDEVETQENNTFSPPLPPRPGVSLTKPFSAPPLPPRGTSSKVADPLRTPASPPVKPRLSLPSSLQEGPSSSPTIPFKPPKLVSRTSSSTSTLSGFHTTPLIQQSLLAAEGARKEVLTSAERERRVEVIGSSSLSSGGSVRGKSDERQGTSKWATVQGPAGSIGKGPASSTKGHQSRSSVGASSAASLQAMLKPPPPPPPPRRSSTVMSAAGRRPLVRTASLSAYSRSTSTAEETLRDGWRAMGSKAEEGVGWLRNAASSGGGSAEKKQEGERLIGRGETDSDEQGGWSRLD